MWPLLLSSIPLCIFVLLSVYLLFVEFYYSLEEYELDKKTVTDTFAKYKAKYSV